jgi:hypothetical protein
MMTVQAMADAAHAALAEYPKADASQGTINTPGYVVAAVRTRVGPPDGIEILHLPVSDDPERHTHTYQEVLAKTPRLSGCAVEWVSHPCPKVVIRGG